MGEIDPWKSRELEEVIAEKWPINIEKLQDLIDRTLDNWKSSVNDIKSSKENWHSYNTSKAKSQRSFKVDYVPINLRTNVDRQYGEKEAERIIVESSPKNWIEDNYKITGEEHLLDTQIAQLVLDVFNACEKIRTN